MEAEKLDSLHNVSVYKKISSSGLFWVWVSIVIFLLDRVTKELAIFFLIEYEPVTVTQFFNLTLAYNKGAAFNFLKNASGWQTWFFSGLAIGITVAIMVWLKRMPKSQRFLSISLTLIIGGAIGNLFDRMYYGEVIDFIQLHLSHFYWPIFNIADSAVCVGAAMLFMESMRGKKNKPHETIS